MIILINGLQYTGYKKFEWGVVGETACADSWGRALKTGEPSLSLPCYAERRYGGVPDEEMLMALSPAHLAKAITGMKALAEERPALSDRALRHPERRARRHGRVLRQEIEREHCRNGLPVKQLAPRKSIMKPSSKFDIVVYGATGFTGQLVAEYLAAHYRGDGSLKWAMAGRSLDKLASVRDAIGAPADTALIVADASDPASLKAMVDQTKSVLTTVGPYQLYGSELVAACAASGTDYLDLCGEPVWMRQMIDAHEAAAQTSGARIVFSCGFDSLPFELGVFFCQETAKKVLGAPVTRVKGRVRDMKGTFSGGTAASIKATFAAAAKDLSLVALLNDPFVLTPGFEGPKQPPGNKPAVRSRTWMRGPRRS